jgi:hypothetical protein
MKRLGKPKGIAPGQLNAKSFFDAGTFDTPQIARFPFPSSVDLGLRSAIADISVSTVCFRLVAKVG